jgi:hypothetical protein
VLPFVPAVWAASAAALALLVALSGALAVSVAGAAIGAALSWPAFWRVLAHAAAVSIAQTATALRSIPKPGTRPIPSDTWRRASPEWHSLRPG